MIFNKMIRRGGNLNLNMRARHTYPWYFQPSITFLMQFASMVSICLLIATCLQLQFLIWIQYRGIGLNRSSGIIDHNAFKTTPCVRTLWISLKFFESKNHTGFISLEKRGYKFFRSIYLEKKKKREKSKLPRKILITINRSITRSAERNHFRVWNHAFQQLELL